MRRFTFYILVAVVTFSSIFFIDTEKQTVAENRLEVVQADILKPKSVLTNSKIELNEENCEEWSDEVDYQPIIKKWLNGEKLKNVPYCSKEAKEAKTYSGSNRTPTLIDWNKDGKEELALQSYCSPTGNCNMEIFEKKGESYRKIFIATHGIQVFKLNDTSNKEFYDISAYMHGSANSGDLVVYRFDGNKYKPLKCFNYIYEEIENGNIEVKFKDEPTLTQT
ncbi:MAG: hypothetical protein ACR2J3_01410, partial [Aridibacter sp.]